MQPRLRSGFTLIELMIAIALIAIVTVKLTMVIKQSTQVNRRESTVLALEDQAQRILDKISFAIIGSDSSTLVPNVQFPFFSSELKYQVSMGVENGATVWSDPEVIGQAEHKNELYWARNPGKADERYIVWCSSLSELLKDELANGSDDNKNGLTDEAGVNFVIDREAVTIRLTLERTGKHGDPIRFTKETTVTCRN